MAIALYESALYGPLFADRHIVDLFSDVRRVGAMVQVENALAQVQAELGIIPASAAVEIERVTRGFVPDLVAIGESTRLHGVPVVGLLNQLRAAAGADAARYLHHGATSQDIVDSAHVLLLQEALVYIQGRLERLTAELGALADRHRGTLMAARTRMQQALPSTFGLKVANWLMPLIRHRQRLEEIKPRVLAVQSGGAAGTMAALGARGIEVMQALAERLQVAAPIVPWHAQRDGFAELAGWLCLVTGSIGKMGQDIVLLSQSEVGEVAEDRQGGSGSSSTMPNKSNPINAEMLVTAARMNTSLLPNMHHALLAEHERAAYGWQLEWNTLPQMLCCTGAALGRAVDLSDGLFVDRRRMTGNLSASNGLLLSELAVFALAGQIGRSRAEEVVRAAGVEARAAGRHLMDILQETSSIDIDWQAYRDPSNYLGKNDALIDRVLGALHEMDAV